MMNLQNQFNNPNLKLSSAQQTNIKNKLFAAGDYLQAAYSKLGADTQSGEQDQNAGGAPSKGKGPIAQFLNFLTDGIQQLESTKTHVHNIGKQGVLSPGDFLLIQLKLSKAQQELEFTGVLLSKTIDGFKQIMGVQI
jgi:flagellar hook-basal body complex protein FliE